MTEIAPAILSNDINDFRKKYSELFALSHYFRTLHVDFADGVFVPTQTVMPKDLFFLDRSPLNLVAHFMTYHPQKYFRAAEAAGFTTVLVHYEAFEHKKQLEETIMFGKHLDLRVGLVINPETKLHEAAKFIKQVAIVQLMSIHPGGQGREFMPATYERIKELRALSKSVIIVVDGGVKVGIAKKLAKAGADILVAGSAILKAENEEVAIEAIEEDIKKNN